MVTAADILEFWFGRIDELGNVAEDRAWLWWKKNADTDALIRDRYEAHLMRAASGQLDSWALDPHGRLALIITLDQFPRSIYRGRARAFGCDERALKLCLDGVEQDQDRALVLIERAFFYMPLEHAEDPALQQRSVALFTTLRDEAPPTLEGAFGHYLMFAERHQAIIERFGRFPHRNAILGRPSTAEESAFLLEPDSSF